MLADELVRPTDAEAPARGCQPQWREVLDALSRGFGVAFTLVNGATGEVLHASPSLPARDETLRAELCREVARRGRPEFIDEAEPLVVLAVPLSDARGDPLVAVAPFCTRQPGPDEDLSAASVRLGLSAAETADWASRQEPWSPRALLRVAELVQTQINSQQRVRKLEEESGSLSVHLANSYEEISLLYRLTKNLRLSKSDEDLARVALEWIQEVLPAKGLAIQLLPVAQQEESLTHVARTQPTLLAHGDCPVDLDEFSTLVGRLSAHALNRPMVVNRTITGRPDWPCPQVRQMIAVALAEGENLFGWLAVFNHTQDGEFGSVEASLLSSVGAILGIHSGNIELYRQQSELLAGIVRALTSAIDAKDQYTCGHSDRVARVAVRLAEELGCDSETLNMVYLSGLLHDIGKIGVDDSVLRKPGRLTDAEYEHIKKHVEIGHRILVDLKKLDDVLPVVLYHHESWDGRGYPHHLHADSIPLPARIVAVADSFDAMGSDRPYRTGMPDAKIDEIFRVGSGQQWDPKVVAAFFRARNDIRHIAQEKQDLAEIKLPQLG